MKSALVLLFVSLLTGIAFAADRPPSTPPDDGLSACAQALDGLLPDDPRAIHFAWSLALRRGDLHGARGLVERARAVGMAAVLLHEMDGVTGSAEQAAAARAELAGRATVGRRFELPSYWHLVAFAALLLGGVVVLAVRSPRARAERAQSGNTTSVGV